MGSSSNSNLISRSVQIIITLCGVLFRRIIENVYFALMWAPKKVFKFIEQIVEVALKAAKTTFQKAFLFCLLIFTIMILAVLSYTVFYSIYLPKAEISRPIHFSYRVCAHGHGLCSFPSANISFLNKDGTEQEFLGRGQQYTVDLELELPDTPRNRDLGMFQILIQMTSRGGHISAETKRSTMLRYRSLPLRLLEQLLLWPLYLLEFLEQKQTLNVELFPNYVDSYYHPSVGANIEIQNHLVQFYSARLKFIAGFTRLKYLMYYWPVTSAVCGIFCNSIVIAAFFLAAIIKQGKALSVVSEVLELDNASQSSQNVTSEGRTEQGSNTELLDQKLKATELLEDQESLSSEDSTEMTNSEKPKDNQSSTNHDVYDLPTLHYSEETRDEENLEFVTELRQRRIN